MNLFAEIERTNLAYCESLGLPSDAYTRPLAVAEVYGTPPNAAEIETHNLIEAGVPAEAAIPVFRPRKAKYLKYWPRTPIQQLGYVEEQIKQGCYQPTEV